MYQNPKKSTREKVRNSLLSHKPSNIGDPEKNYLKRDSNISVHNQIKPVFFQKGIEKGIPIKQWFELKSHEIRAMNRALSFGRAKYNQSKWKESEKFSNEDKPKVLCGNCGLRKKQDFSGLKKDPNL